MPSDRHPRVGHRHGQHLPVGIGGTEQEGRTRLVEVVEDVGDLGRVRGAERSLEGRRRVREEIRPRRAATSALEVPLTKTLAEKLPSAFASMATRSIKVAGTASRYTGRKIPPNTQ